MFATNIIYFLKSIKFFIVYSKCGHKYEKIFKREESIETLTILELINNIEKYHKMYNHAWRKHKTRL